MTTTVLCDLDGVLYRGEAAVPGAGDALSRMTHQGHELWFVTNNSARTPAQVASVIRDRTGFEAEPRQILTSGLAAALALEGRAATAQVVGGEGVRRALADSGIEVSEHSEEAVVVGLDRNFDYTTLDQAAAKVRQGALFLATNRDSTFPGESRLHPGAGAILAAIETASGREAEVCGKPYAPMRDLIKSRITLDNVWVVGDRVDTDLEMARREGWTQLLVLTGIDTDAPPDVAAVSSIAAVPDIIMSAPSGADGASA